MRELFRRDDEGVYRFLPWLEVDWLDHGFGTRLSGAWNRRPELIGLNQIHSNIATYADGRRRGRIGEGDALLTDVPGALAGVRTADCVPILIVDVSKRAVAAVHAGWRGTVDAVAAKTVAAMGTRFGSDPGELAAVIGPAIGACCYEVGSEVAARFDEVFLSKPNAGGSARLDLPEANRQQLLSAGLQRDRVWACSLCTSCLAEEFFSWRRDREGAGRMVSAIGVRPENEKGAGPAHALTMFRDYPSTPR